MHCNEYYIHNFLKKSMSVYWYFFCYLTFGLFDHFFFIIFNINCDDDGLSITNI